MAPQLTIYWSAVGGAGRWQEAGALEQALLRGSRKDPQGDESRRNQGTPPLSNPLSLFGRTDLVRPGSFPLES